MFILSIPIGILYNVIAFNINKLITKDLEYQKKINVSILASLIMCIMAIVLSITIFDDNKVVMYGLYLGAFLLFISTILFNWTRLSDTIKIFLFGLLMFVFILYSYTNENEKDFYEKEESNDLAML